MARTIEAIEILGIPVHAVTYAGTLEIMARWIAEGNPHQIATVNPEFVMLANRHAEFRRVLGQADLCVPDGIGLLWAARRLGRELPERVTGSDLVPLVARRAAEHGWRLFLLGAGPGVARKTADLLMARYPGLTIAGWYEGSPADGDAPAAIERIREAHPDVLFVAYGAPAQDLWIDRYRRRLGVPVMAGVGGAFDHLAGVRRRAPVWIQRIHLEWLFRLATQPWRWRRQLALPRFVWAVMQQARRQRARIGHS